MGGSDIPASEKDAYRYIFRWEKVPQSSKTLHGPLSVDVLCFVLVFCSTFTLHGCVCHAVFGFYDRSEVQISLTSNGSDNRW